MKKKDLRAGMIVEDRGDYQRNYLKRPYKLILHVDEFGYSYLDSEKQDWFYVPMFMNTDPAKHTSFCRVRDLKLIR